MVACGMRGEQRDVGWNVARVNPSIIGVVRVWCRWETACIVPRQKAAGM